MRPKDRPVGRTGPINKNLEEPIMIDVEEPEIAGVKPEAPVLTPIRSADVLKRRKSSWRKPRRGAPPPETGAWST